MISSIQGYVSSIHLYMFFAEVRVVHLFSFLSCDFCVLFCLSAFCVLCPVLPVSLDCPLFAFPSGFSK